MGQKWSGGRAGPQRSPSYDSQDWPHTPSQTPTFVATNTITARTRNQMIQHLTPGSCQVIFCKNESIWAA